MRIGELSKKSGQSVDTIRFYERMGLLTTSEVCRSPNGYRDYTPAALERLQLIKTAQNAGFTLRELVTLFDDAQHNRLGNDEVVIHLQHKFDELTLRIKELEHMRQAVALKLKTLAKRAA
jgi:MerR family transcriptional regulator, copper efflux regulator